MDRRCQCSKSISFVTLSVFRHITILYAVLYLVVQSCPTVCDPLDCSPPGSSVHGISQARILEQVAMPSFRGSSQLRGQAQISHTAGRFLSSEPLGKLEKTGVGKLSLLQGNFPTQESIYLHCRWILYQLSYRGSPVPYFVTAWRNNSIYTSHFVHQCFLQTTNIGIVI